MSFYYDEDNNATNSVGGLGLGTILFVVFLVLKLCGVISWSWVWVLSPLWISLLLWIIILFIAWIVVRCKYKDLF